ncbi:hypothetical protein ACPWT1_01475 [Ramlibacter sp. MMS24-I3-19]|uniref:hypothetical protein n=1 Tax=Ramlibacter sp. MMS24-I3-19 TaxID=3416606 RepID=UPI003D001D8F
MFYVIDAVRWGADGHISHVKWHGVEADGETLVRTEPQIVPVVDAAQMCGEKEVRVYVGGDLGRFFRMRACPEGIDAESDPSGAPLRERMAHLPTF